MNSYIKLVLSILYVGILLLACGGGAKSDIIEDANLAQENNVSNIYESGDTFDVAIGDKIMAYDFNTKVNIITDAQTGKSTVTILSGKVEYISNNEQ